MNVVLYWRLLLDYTFFYCAEKIHVKCNQSGKVFKTKITSLSTEEGDYLTAADLVAGNELIMDYDKKSYPVTVIKISGVTSDGQSAADSTPSDGKSMFESE